MPKKISAILPTRNRAGYLPRVLDSIRAQTLDKSAFEIIAIDDGSTDDTARILVEAATDLPITMMRQNHAGLASAKNLGIFAAKAPIVTFLDDDDILAPDNFVAHLNVHFDNPANNVAVLGMTDIDHAVQSPLMSYVTDTAGLLFSYHGLTPGQRLDYTRFWGGRSSCKRDFIIDQGLFNPIFRFGFEDIECGWRMRRQDFTVIFEPKAASTMIRRIDFQGFCIRSYRQGKAAYVFHQMHNCKEIRNYLQIDAAARRWSSLRRDYAQIMRRAQAAHNVALVADADDDQQDLHALYRSAFELCYAKGLADAAWRHDAMLASETKALAA